MLERLVNRAFRAFVGALALVATGLAWAQGTAEDYTLAAGDTVRISVYQSPDLTLEARLSESGVIGYPLLGPIRLGGLSVLQAQVAIATGLRDGGFVRQPQVNLQVTQVRGHQVSALGMFNRPGRYALEKTGTTVSDLIALAGGIAVTGADVVTLKGVRDGRPYIATVDVADLLKRDGAGDPTVSHGDTIYVDRAPIVYVHGQVNRPGQLRLERDMDVRRALAAAGGLTVRGTERGVRLHRRDDNDTVVELRPALTDRPRDGDVIHVPESLF